MLEYEIAPGRFNVVLTTFEFALRDKRFLKKIAWLYIVVDEVILLIMNINITLRLGTQA